LPFSTVEVTSNATAHFYILWPCCWSMIPQNQPRSVTLSLSHTKKELGLANEYYERLGPLRGVHFWYYSVLKRKGKQFDMKGRMPYCRRSGSPNYWIYTYHRCLLLRTNLLVTKLSYNQYLYIISCKYDRWYSYFVYIVTVTIHNPRTANSKKDGPGWTGHRVLTSNYRNIQNAVCYLVSKQFRWTSKCLVLWERNCY